MRSHSIIRNLFLIIFVHCASALFSHSVEYSIISDKSFKIEVTMGDDEPMRQAQVLIFPPNQQEYTNKIQTDESGCFYLTPNQSGTWIMQVKGDGGHAIRINLPIKDSQLASKETRGSSFSLLQNVIMLLSVLWGTIGTVLYFHNRKRK